MNSSVLFDAPGPATVARHRIYTVISVIALVGLLTFFLWRLYENGQLAYDLWEPFVTPAYMEALLLGLLKTLEMAFSAILLAVFFGVIFGVGKLSDRTWLRWPCWAIVEFFRAVPVLLLMVLFFLYYGINGGTTGAYWTVVLALMFYNGAVLAEVFRAGIQAVPRGQAEAAYAVGMRKSQVMNVILLPQAVKIMLPAIISQCVVALKDTSLGYAVAAPGLTYVGQQIYRQFGNQVPTSMVLAAMYIAVCLLLTWLATWVQKKFVGEKKPLEVSAVGHFDDGAAKYATVQ